MPIRQLYILKLVAILLFGASLLMVAPQSASARMAGMEVVDPVVSAEDAPAAENAADASEAVVADANVDMVVSDHADAAAAGHDVAVHEEKEGGFPQLDTSTYASQIFWLFISFILLYSLMSRIALPRITEVLELRQTQREGNLNRAEQLQEDAEKVKATVDAALAKAQAEAQDTLSANEQQRAKKNAAENARFLEHARNRIASAEQNIAKAKEEALHSLADISAEIAADITQKIAATPVTKAEAKKVVADIMKEAA
jgi:F-type H+-transporting ATPase subunit b